MTVITVGGRPITVGPGFVTRPTNLVETGAVQVLHRATTSFAPEPIQFGVDFTGTALDLPLQGDFDPKLKHYYFWDFGDPTKTFDYLTAMGNLGWDDPNTSIAPKPQHTFMQGTYTVSVSVFAVVGGVLRRVDASTTVTIADPDTVFSGMNTIYISDDLDVSGAPAGALTMPSVTDLASVLVAELAGQEVTPKRFMLKDGATFSFTGIDLGASPPLYPSFMICKSGAGANPLINQTGQINLTDIGDPLPNTQLPNRTKDIVFYGVDWDGGFNSNTQAGSANQSHVLLLDNISPNVICWHKCRLTGYPNHVYIQPGPDNGPNMVVADDCDFTDYWSVILWSFETSVFAMTGCLFGSAPTAMVGPEDEAFNGGFPVRQESVSSVIDQCRGMNKQGWVPPHPTLNGAGRVDVQASLRLCAFGRQGQDTSVTRCIIEGGFSLINFAAVTPEPPRPAAMVLCRNCVLIGDYGTRHMIIGNIGGTVIDNVIGIWPEGVPDDNGAGLIFSYSNDTGAAANLLGPMEATNCSAIYMRTGVQAPSIRASIMNNEGPANGTFANEYEAGSLIYSREEDTSQGPLTQTDLGIPLRNTEGFRGRDGVVQSVTATPAGEVLEYAPTGASPAIGAVSGLVSPFSRNDRQRAGSDNLGAV